MKQNATPFYVRSQSRDRASQAKSAKLSGTNAPLIKLNDSFHRVDTQLTREVNGLGMGLAICKRIVELHNGILWAENNKPHGRGSAFYVRLPMSDIPIT